MSKHYHFIGIGGIGMSGIAKLLLGCAHKVSGSDVKESKVTEELKSLGAIIYIGHESANIQGASEVIYSSAIKEDNPEFIEALAKGIPLIRRAEALAQLMANKCVITIAGSHGKTTTTSLVSYMLLEAGLNPTVAIGGILRNINSNACFGNGKYFVAEADESDGSFLNYRPHYSIITNIDREHLDYYRDFSNEVNAFKDFLNRTEESGCVFCCADDENLNNILKGYKGRFCLFGLKEGADIYAGNIELKGLASEFDCFYKNKFIKRFFLALGGEHNISNALAVIALGFELGIGLEEIEKTLAQYKGAGRRLEVKYSDLGVVVLDDYAHHPTEIKATLSAVSSLKKNRTIAVFQPHRFSRTRLLMDEFSTSFNAADCIIITDIYPAGEEPIAGVSSEILAEKIKKRSPEKDILYMPKDKIAGYLKAMIRPQDLVITLGAGDIVKVCDELVERLKKQS